MAKFCTQCGRPLADGEVCNCWQKAGGGQQQDYSQQFFDRQDDGGQFYSQQGYEQNDGRDRQSGSFRAGGQASGRESGDTITISTEDWIPIRKLIGVGESAGTDVQGCFERGKRIVPDLIAPSEQEIPVKQYHVCNARSRLRGLWQEGRIQVTNKRILFRLSGRSWIGKAMAHTEFSLDELAGISISNGVRFGLWDFLIGWIICAFVMAIGSAVGSMPALLAYILGVALAVPFFLLRKKYFIKALCLALGAGALSSSSVRMIFSHPYLSRFGMFLTLLVFILYLAALFLFALKPSLSIMVMTKCASDKPIYVWNRQSLISIMEILPGEDADVAIEELGAMIMDIQKLGDTGVRKWKED